MPVSRETSECEGGEGGRGGGEGGRERREGLEGSELGYQVLSLTRLLLAELLPSPLPNT